MFLKNIHEYVGKRKLFDFCKMSLNTKLLETVHVTGNVRLTIIKHMLCTSGFEFEDEFD